MSSNSSMQEVLIDVFTNSTTVRTREPLTLGLPWPQGKLRDEKSLSLTDASGQCMPLQCQILDRWSDGSIRWLLLDWQASYQEKAQFQLSASSAPDSYPQAPTLQIEVTSEAARISTGHGHFLMTPGNATSLLEWHPISSANSKPDVVVSLKVKDDRNRLYDFVIRTITIEERGSLRASLCLKGILASPAVSVSLAEVTVRLHFFAGLSTIRVESTICNPRKADHPGGLWDLGNGGSIYLRDASLLVSAVKPQNSCRGTLSPETEMQFHFQNKCELYQDSSGGVNWNSNNHVNRHGKVPLEFRGYRTRMDGHETFGLRASPTLHMQAGDSTLGMTVPLFWQNFPQALEARPGELTYRLFPEQSQDVHEIQGGEQKTHRCYLTFGKDTVTNEPLSWCRTPGNAVVQPWWYAHAGVVPFLVPRSSDPHPEYLQLVDAALEGSDTFASKREVIDEFGWRHFGDIYGDHEAVNQKGPQPLISHYNNQYDAIAGFGFQYLRSADTRWLQAMEELAQHVIDIDIYHTDLDKSAYNHGLFWHTFHYVDAHTGTHRSYPRDARVPPHGHPVPGGGPANEQNYTTGLMLHYFLTGYRPSRDAAIGLAQWVIDMDDGSKTIFRWLCRSDTGMASKSRTAEYHGPGRGAANSIAALIDGHRLTGEARFLEKAEQLIRRCIHPMDNVERRNLLDAENRWFYTMFLQSLGRYLHYKEERNENDGMYAYARASLLHYVHWMAQYEYPYLEKPEILEFPTETWAAQDMRKCEIFNIASVYADNVESSLFREKADYFFRYTTTKLLSMPTRTLCRPVVLMLSFGFAHAWFKQHPNHKAVLPLNDVAFGNPIEFVPQKVIAIKRAKIVFILAGAAFCLFVAYLVYWLFRS